MRIFLVLGLALALVFAGCAETSSPQKEKVANDAQNYLQNNAAPRTLDVEAMLTYGGQKKGTDSCSSDAACDDGLLFTQDSCGNPKYPAFSHCVHTNMFSCPTRTCQQIKNTELRDQCFNNAAAITDNIVPGGPKISIPKYGICCIAILNPQLQKTCVEAYLNAAYNLSDAETPGRLGNFLEHYSSYCVLLNDQSLKDECIRKETVYVTQYGGGQCSTLYTDSDIQKCAVSRGECNLLTDQNLKDQCLLQSTN